MHIGMIGGIGPAATDFYYRRLITAFADRNAPLELTIVHADTPTLLQNLAADDVAAQVAIYERLTERLAAAGAQCVVVTSISGHFCIEAFKPVSALPVIDLIEQVDREITLRGLGRIGVLGTRTVMETGVYGRIRSADVIAPKGRDLEAVHTAYVAMAAAGVVSEAQKAVFFEVGQRLLDEDGVDAILLGGTDLALVFTEHATPFPIVDCAAIHVDDVVRRATL